MKFIESIVSKFGPDRINNLAADEERRWREAHHYIRHGWLSGVNSARVKTAGLSDELITDLNSSLAPRQRAAINHPALQAYVRSEIQREYALKSMAYFKEKLDSSDGFSFAKAEQILRDEGNFCFKNGFVEDSESGRTFRRLVLFASSKDEEVLFVIAHFLKLFVSTLGSLMQKYESSDISDQLLRQELINSLPAVTSTFTDSALRRFIDAMERAANCEEPKAICPYMDVLRTPDLQDQLVSAQLERKRETARKRAADIAEQEQKAAAEAARALQEQKRIRDQQLNLTVDDECLDITPGEWPKLQGEDAFKGLLANMQSAFSTARSVITRITWDGHEFGAVRSLASMNAKQIACVKIKFWWNRSGLIPSDRHHMFWLLHCDGRAAITSAGQAATFFLTAYASDAVNLELEWSHHLGFLQQSIDDEGFKGELARWFVADRDDDGWATSR